MLRKKGETKCEKCVFRCCFSLFLIFSALENVHVQLFFHSPSTLFFKLGLGKVGQAFFPPCRSLFIHPFLSPHKTKIRNSKASSSRGKASVQVERRSSSRTLRAVASSSSQTSKKDSHCYDSSARDCGPVPRRSAPPKSPSFQTSPHC